MPNSRLAAVSITLLCCLLPRFYAAASGTGDNTVVFPATNAAHAESLAAKPYADITTVPVPDSGIQPRVAIDRFGRIHLVYFRGEPAHGDLFYATSSREDPGRFTKPIRVNHADGSACTLGTVRGAQLAVSSDGQVFVVWNGSRSRQGDGSIPFLFSRLNAALGSFEPERNLLGAGQFIDGGGAIAAGNSGTVYVFWHACRADRKEAAGRVYMVRSSDRGASFSSPAAITAADTGTCSCCAMDASFAAGNLFVIYRRAANDSGRDTVLLKSTDRAKTFAARTVQCWSAPICPMTTFALSNHDGEVEAAWESPEGIEMVSLNSPRLKSKTVAAGANKFPTLACGSNGTSLLTYINGSSWQRGGMMHWTLVDRQQDRLATACAGLKERSWSFATPLYLARGKYAIFY